MATIPLLLRATPYFGDREAWYEVRMMKLASFRKRIDETLKLVPVSDYAAKGLLIRTPRISCPSFKSSVYSTLVPDLAAATTANASQNESFC